MKNCFSALDAVTLFEGLSGHQLRSIDAARLLAYRGIKRVGKDRFGKSTYDAYHFEMLWEDMFKLAVTNHRYLPNSPKPIKCDAPLEIFSGQGEHSAHFKKINFELDSRFKHLIEKRD